MKWWRAGHHGEWKARRWTSHIRPNNTQKQSTKLKIPLSLKKENGSQCQSLSSVFSSSDGAVLQNNTWSKLRPRWEIKIARWFSNPCAKDLHLHLRLNPHQITDIQLLLCFLFFPSCHQTRHACSCSLQTVQPQAAWCILLKGRAVSFTVRILLQLFGHAVPHLVAVFIHDVLQVHRHQHRHTL